MSDESWSLRGWSSVPVFLLLGVTPVLTALIMSLPVAWLVNHLFAANLIRSVFGCEHLGYWRSVGLFALWFSARFKIKISGSFQVPKP